MQIHALFGLPKGKKSPEFLGSWDGNGEPPLEFGADHRKALESEAFLSVKVFKVDLPDALLLQGLQPPTLIEGLPFVSSGEDGKKTGSGYASIHPPVLKTARRPLSLSPASLGIYVVLTAFLVAFGACGGRTLTRAVESATLGR